MHIHIYMCVCICIYICTYIYICICICVYTHIGRWGTSHHFMPNQIVTTTTVSVDETAMPVAHTDGGTDRSSSSWTRWPTAAAERGVTW